MRELVTLICSQCLSRNYKTRKGVGQPRLELHKYCRNCKRQTLHKETK